MKEPKNNILSVPNPALSKPAKKVTQFDESLKKTAMILTTVLRENRDNGIGVAANQLGIDSKIFAVEFINDEGKTEIPLQFFVNPEIINFSEEQETLDEGCLSVPDVFLPIVRSTKIKFKAYDLKGKRTKLTAVNLLARLIQHETDHLNGKLFIDHYRQQLLNEAPEIKKLRLVFIGSGDFAEIILRGLILMNLNISLVISEQAKPGGRDKKIISSPVAQTAKIFGKRLLESGKITDNFDDILAVNPDLIVLADFGQVIPEEILGIPKISAINIHPSLLPKYRGATPIASAILAGENETGVSIMQMNAKIDEGKIIAQEKLEIFHDDNAYSLEIRLANLGLKTLLPLLKSFQQKNFILREQDHGSATLTRKFSKKSGQIDWRKNLKEIDRQIRAYYPWPGSFTFVGDKRLIIHVANLENDKLVLEVVQPEGKQPMSFEDFLKGFRGNQPDWFKFIKLEKPKKNK